MANRQINNEGLELVKFYESFRGKAYLCPAGKLTIGYGHVILGNEPHLKEMEIDEAHAEKILRSDLAIAEKAVNRYITVDLNSNEYSALCSFTFNLGGGNLSSSTLRRLLNKGEYESVPDQLHRWVYAGKKRLNGLVKRRHAEGLLFGKLEVAQKCCCPCHKK